MSISNINATFPAYAAELDAVLAVEAPEPTDSWHPLSHREALNLTMAVLEKRDMEVIHAEYGLAGKTGIERFFAVLDLRSNGSDYGMAIGIGNSIDKSFPYRLVGGERVFVCSNLCFSGDFSVKRKHTANLMQDLPGLIEVNVNRYLDRFVDREREIARWKKTEVDERTAAHTILQAVKNRAIPVKACEKVYDEFRSPRHPEFRDRTVWSLQNAFTEIHKSRTLEPNASSYAMLALTQTLRAQFPEPAPN